MGSRRLRCFGRGLISRKTATPIDGNSAWCTAHGHAQGHPASIRFEVPDGDIDGRQCDHIGPQTATVETGRYVAPEDLWGDARLIEDKSFNHGARRGQDDFPTDTAEHVSKTQTSRTIGVPQFDQYDVDCRNTRPAHGLIQLVTQQSGFGLVETGHFRSLQ